jgi:hypothetical protein
MLVEETREPVGMAAHDQMQQLVNKDVLKTLGRLLGQFRVKPNAFRERIAAPPTSFSFFARGTGVP